MSQSSPGEAVLDRILRKDVSKTVRSSSLLYLANAVLYVFIGRALLFFLPSSLPTQVETVLEGYVGVVAIYAIIIYLWTRSRQNRGSSVHFYLLGLLGLTGGGLLFAFGAVGFLSAGYWLRQFREGSSPKCTKDGGNVVAFGEENLVCTKCSRLVKIGYELPRKWNYAGTVLLLAGIGLYSLASIVPLIASFAYVPLNIPTFLIFDGIILLSPLYLQRMYFGGNVRLPPGIGEPGTDERTVSQQRRVASVVSRG